VLRPWYSSTGIRLILGVCGRQCILASLARADGLAGQCRVVQGPGSGYLELVGSSSSHEDGWAAERSRGPKGKGGEKVAWSGTRSLAAATALPASPKRWSGVYHQSGMPELMYLKTHINTAASKVTPGSRWRKSGAGPSPSASVKRFSGPRTASVLTDLNHPSASTPVTTTQTWVPRCSVFWHRFSARAGVHRLRAKRSTEYVPPRTSARQPRMPQDPMLHVEREAGVNVLCRTAGGEGAAKVFCSRYLRRREIARETGHLIAECLL